jgi:hypothetical protein
MSTVLDREEYIEQAYFFHVFRERLGSNLAAQDVLERVAEEILSTTRLPMAIQFLSTEMKHSGLLSTGFSRLSHYFTPFQTFVIRQTEDERMRFSADTALEVLEREAQYRAGEPTRPGLFIYEFEVLSRNRLGYDDGLRSIAADPFFDADWRDYIEWVRRQVGIVDVTEFVYLRSELFVREQRRRDPGYEPPLTPLFGDKEGRIARANRGRDPLYLFAAFQRQLGYPQVPRPKPRDDLAAKMEQLKAKMREMDTRLKLLEGELSGKLDLNQFLKQENLLNRPEEEGDQLKR